MHSHLAQLLFLRASAIITHGIFLLIGTLLFAFGLLELFGVFTVLALGVIWAGFLPESTRAAARQQHAEFSLGDAVSGSKTADGSTPLPSVDETAFARLRSFRLRSRTRRQRKLRHPKLDVVIAAIPTVVWAFYIVFLATVTGI